MSADSGAPERREEPDLWALPAVKGVEIALREYDPPRVFVRGPKVLEARSAVELLVETDGPIPVRALSPALFIGSTEVNEVVEEDPTHHRFYLYDTQAARPGAAISLGWIGGVGSRKRTGFKFELG